MSRIKVNMPTEHGQDIGFYFTPYQALKFKNKIMFSKKKDINSRINGHYFTFSKNYISYYKSETFKGPSYSIIVNGLAEKIIIAIDSHT